MQICIFIDKINLLHFVGAAMVFVKIKVQAFYLFSHIQFSLNIETQ